MFSLHFHYSCRSRNCRMYSLQQRKGGTETAFPLGIALQGALNENILKWKIENLSEFKERAVVLGVINEMRWVGKRGRNISFDKIVFLFLSLIIFILLISSFSSSLSLCTKIYNQHIVDDVFIAMVWNKVFLCFVIIFHIINLKACLVSDKPLSSWWRLKQEEKLMAKLSV